MKTRQTLSEAIAARGINAAHEIALLKRRQHYALTCDRTKVYASTPLGNIPVFGRRADGTYTSIHHINADLGTLKFAAADPALQLQPTLVSTADYVAAWCRLNHLKP